MIDINDKNGGIHIEISGNRLKNLYVLGEIFDDLAETDNDIAEAMVLSLVKIKGEEFITRQTKKAVEAKKQVDKLYEKTNEEDLEKILGALRKFVFEGDDDDE